jgi:hypothetical protein
MRETSILRVFLASLGFALGVAPLAVADAAAIAHGKDEDARQAYGRVPLHFEPNQGQAPASVQFLARGAGYGFFLGGTEARLVLRAGDGPKASRGGGPIDTVPAVVRLRILGGNPEPEAAGLEELAGKSHYFRGNDPRAWRTDVPHYARVRYAGVYPGIDLVYYGNQRQLEYDLIVAPGADPRLIRLGIEGVRSLRLDQDGNLVLGTPRGDLIQQAPIIYQQTPQGRKTVRGGYTLRGRHEVAFRVGAHDRRLPLVIDPVLAYSTYLGGGSSDEADGVAVDASGNAYIVGSTYSTDFPRMGALQGSVAGGQDVFVTKLNAAGSALVYSTYLGGTSDDYGTGIKVDSAGNAYIVGFTYSTNFPTVNAADASFGGDVDGFAAKLNATGSALVYSTYLGDTGYDTSDAVAVDGSGNAYVTGLLTLPTGFGEVFLSKLSTTGAIVYSVYFGGGSSDRGRGVAVDAAGNAYVTGDTCSNDFPTVGPLQPTFGGGCILTGDAFVTKVNATATGLVYSAYLGGRFEDAGYAIALGSDGSAYITGETTSDDFPTVNALQPARRDSGAGEAFVTKVNPAGTALVYSTYLGGNYVDGGRGIAVDALGRAYVTGHTYSDDFPMSSPIQSTLGAGGDADAFVARLNAAGTALAYSTYLGGSDLDPDFILGNDLGKAIAVDGSSNAYVVGSTNAQDFPTQSAYQPFKNGSYDAFIAKLVVVTPPPPLTVSIGDFSVVEGNAGTTLAYLNLTLSAPSAQTVTVSYATANGTATGGSDYVTKSTTLTFAPGQTVETAIVRVLTDLAVEPNETFVVNLTSASGATIADGQGQATIVNDDPSGGAVAVPQYRLFNNVTHEHLYTTDVNEYNVLGANGWVQEGQAYQMFTSTGTYGSVNVVPLFRLYHPQSQQHLWSTDVNEASVLGETPDYIYEGITGYILPVQVAGTVPLYRMFLDGLRVHLWTTDQNEYDFLGANGWVKEGAIGYVIP